jgi:hypothetical protein
MSRLKLRFLLICVFGVLISGAGITEGHWDDTMPAKWVQYPDLTDYNGIDVDATVDEDIWAFPPQVLADDFECTETGELKDIHIWGSWYNDRLPFGDPTQVVFTLSIHADIPIGPGNPYPYSMPGDVLWWRQFYSTDFTVNVWATDLLEGWYVPCVTPPLYEPYADSVCWQYNFYLDQGEFTQLGTIDDPCVYWLDVQARPLDPNARFGWKSSQDHWNDDAVWGIGYEPFLGPWNELRYPIMHPFEQQSIDLAFVITGEEGTHNDIEYGDAPEGTTAVAYPSSGVTGAFPTCVTSGPASFISHGLGWAHFVFPAGGAPAWDPEADGDAGLCPPPGCFPTYDDDECYLDGDAGLMFPEPFTIDPLLNVVTCPCSVGTPLGTVCTTATWGVNVDIWVVNTMPVIGYVNVLMDWKQDGFWAGVANCGAVGAPEHVLVDWPVPIGYAGPLSGLPAGPPPAFLIGPNSGYVWSRFSITNVPVNNSDWDGSGSFEDGETEDYLLWVDRVTTEELDFGDAPDPNYPTLLASNGARHVISGPFFCDAAGLDSPDSEADGQPHPWAIGDDIDADGDDEDGVVFPVMTIGVPTTISLNVCGAPAAGAWVQIWIDWNGNEIWEAAEQVHNAMLANGAHLIPVTAPNGSATGITFARCRISSGGGLAPTGPATDGEVEDHRVEVLPPEEAKPLIEHSKWSQPPIEMDPNMPIPYYCGWDQESWVQDLDQWWLNYASVADDFRCLGTMPITSVHWWGSYIDWDMEQPPPLAPIAWVFRFWTNVAADPTDPITPHSHPRSLLWEVMVDAPRVDTEWVGWDEFPGRLPETCFQHNVEFEPDEWFWQHDYNDLTKDQIFWLNIMAVYPNDIDVVYPWGWKTRPWSWMDDAVSYECHLIDPCTVLCTFWPIKDPVWDESYDVAFELDTDPNYIKWEQHYTGIRHWPHYEDEKSMANEDASGTIDIIRQVADDWECDSNTPITAVTWWGSYIGYRYQACTTPQPPPPKPSYFLLNIWTDVPATPGSHSHPNEPVWEYKAYDYDEVLVGFDKHPELVSGPPREPVFRYSVKIPCQKWFFQKDPNTIYWISVVAVYKAPDDPLYDWGWTNHAHVFNDDAVAGYVDPLSGTWVWEELFDQTEQSEDMSFILFTDPDPNLGTCWDICQCPCQPQGDCTCDGLVNLADLFCLKAHFGKSAPWVDPECCADFTQNGSINLGDLFALKAGFGLPCPPGSTGNQKCP